MDLSCRTILGSLASVPAAFVLVKFILTGSPVSVGDESAIAFSVRLCDLRASVVSRYA